MNQTLIPAKPGRFAGSRRNLGKALAVTALLGAQAMAQETNAGADAIISQIDTLVVVAAGVVVASIAVVVVPWGAKLAIRVFKSIF